MNVAAWTLEYRLLGWRAAGLTALMVSVIAVAAVVASTITAADNATTVLTGGVELGLPLVAGTLAAALIGVDPARELQLSLPTPYRQTVLRRAILAMVWPLLTASILSAVLITIDRWISPGGAAGGQLVWIAPLAWTTAVCCLLTVALRSQAVAVTVVGTLAAAEMVLGSVFRQQGWLHPLYLLATTDIQAHSYWWSNRFALLGTAGAVAIVTRLLLGRPERLLMEDDQ